MEAKEEQSSCMEGELKKPTQVVGITPDKLLLTGYYQPTALSTSSGSSSHSGGGGSGYYQPSALSTHSGPIFITLLTLLYHHHPPIESAHMPRKLILLDPGRCFDEIINKRSVIFLTWDWTTNRKPF